MIVLAGFIERRLRDRALAAVPIRIHVNGTRGKSTVTRLVWAALRNAGIPVLARCTGTAARLLSPDGSERPWSRRGLANIREELRLLLMARRMGARALVVECMAVQPELQWIAEREMIRATHGVITNVRTDHTDSLGRSLEQVAAGLSNTVPLRSTLILGDPCCASLLERRAEALNTDVLHAEPIEDSEVLLPNENQLPAWLIENRKTALAVTRRLGIADETALEGMARYLPDAGAAASGFISLRGRQVPWLNATAANDPESFELLVNEWLPRQDDGTLVRKILIFNHRADRELRLMEFCTASRTFADAPAVWITGDRPSWQLRCRLRGSRLGKPLSYVRQGCIMATLEQTAGGLSGLIFCGNTKGFDRSVLEKEVTYG